MRSRQQRLVILHIAQHLVVDTSILRTTSAKAPLERNNPAIFNLIPALSATPVVYLVLLLRSFVLEVAFCEEVKNWSVNFTSSFYHCI